MRARAGFRSDTGDAMTLRGLLTYEPKELTFGTSGLRGLVTDMTDLECYINTAGFLRFLQQSGHFEPSHTVFVAGDLRDSTDRILRSVHKAITDYGFTTVNCGHIPTPALAFYAAQQGSPCIMVTGSHVPEDRNGIKFYKIEGELLKEDELGVQQAVSDVRTVLYASENNLVTPEGMLVQPLELPDEQSDAAQLYRRRYLGLLDGRTFTGKKIVFYEHSSVGRDMLSTLLEDLGASVVRVGRTDKFIPIDTENVTPDDRAYFAVLAKQHPDALAIVSADGDADRPFVIDEKGMFHRGDVLGAITADWLKADFAAYPVSANDAVDEHLNTQAIKWQHTKIGSPYVIVVMEQAMRAHYLRIVGWEVNGGFLLGSDVLVNGRTLKALPTRDAFLPIVAALCMAIDSNKKISALFDALPQRYTQAGLLNDFASTDYQSILREYLPDTPETRQKLGRYFSPQDGFGAITQINGVDGVRIYFDSGDIAHIRLSSNAPQLRMYSVASTQSRADDIVAKAIADPDGIFRKIQKDLQG
jgi:phosphomannomutase